MFGKAITILAWMLVALGTGLGAAGECGKSDAQKAKDKLFGNEKGFNDMTYEQLAGILRELDLVIPEETVKALDQGFDPQIFDEDTLYNKMAFLLAGVGAGSYDYETWEWTPSSNQIYSFDLETFDMDRMYTAFLDGVSAINQGDFELTQIVEDRSGVDDDTGTGIHKISFCYNGTPYRYEAEAENDWFDTGMLDFMSQVLQKEKSPKQLYYMSDGYQDCIVFYTDQAWADRFTQMTGCDLDKGTND